MRHRSGTRTERNRRLLRNLRTPHRRRWPNTLHRGGRIAKPRPSEPLMGMAPPVGSPAPAWPRAALAWLGTIDLADAFRERLPTIRTVPRFLTAGVRRCLTRCLNDLQIAYRRRDGAAREAAWKLFLLAPRLLLARCRDTGPVGRAALLRRVELFESGLWEQLLEEARAGAPTGQRNPPRTNSAVLEEACERVRQGQLSRARQALTAAALAPGTDETLQALSDPTRRPPSRHREIPAEVLSHEPAEAVTLSVQQVAESLRSARRGSAPGLSGATVDHYKLLLDDPAALELLAFAVNCLARADVPPVIVQALSLSRLPALRKPGGGVRGIATGDVFRRLVSRVLARAFANVFDEATRPHQFALRTRAGTDSLAAMLRAATELDPDATIVSLDGRVRMTASAAQPSWANSRRLRPKSCLSSGPCTHVSPHTSGGTTTAAATRSRRPKGSNRAIA